MTNKTQPVRIDLDQYKDLQTLRKLTGVPVAESVRRALKLYLTAQKERHASEEKQNEQRSQ